MNFEAWASTHLPFIALFAQKVPVNRPMLTRITEQALVGVVAAALGIYGNNIKQQGQIENLNERVASIRLEQSTAMAALRLDQKDAMAALQQTQKESMVNIGLKIDEMRRDLYIPRESKK